MRLVCLSLTLFTACSPNLLRVGDQAFAEARYGAAAQAYAQVDPAEADAVLFRMAILYEAAPSPLHNSARSRETLQEVAGRFPGSPYGIAARMMLEQLRKQGELEAQLRVLNDEITQEKGALATSVAQRQQDAQTHQAALTKLQDEQQQLNLQLKVLRDEFAKLREEHASTQQQLETENTRLKEQLDELKRIDLRR